MTDEAKLYVVRNDDGEYLMNPAFAAWFPGWTDDITTADMYEHKEAAEETANECDGHVVELVEAPAKIAVSEAEAKMLERVKSREEYPAEIIHRYVYDSHNFSEWDYDREIRLMRAYVIGWTVEKPKQWNVNVPHVAHTYYWKRDDGSLTIGNHTYSSATRFTSAEIDQYGLQDCQKTEVIDGEAD